MPDPRLSVIVPTANRQDLLARLLASLDELRVAPGEMEVIVVDDASTDGTLNLLASHPAAYPLRVFQLPEPSGPAAARNRAAAAARGEILGFLDSDVIVHPRWWQAAAPHFDQPEVAAVEGATHPPVGSARPTPFTNFVSNTRGGSFQTCNLLVRASVFRELGGFDEQFCFRTRRGRLLHSREDSDLAFSILERGGRIDFEPGTIVFHPLPAPNPGLEIMKTRYGFQEALLRRKHPQLYRTRLKWLDGRALPVPYWGVYLGWPLLLGGAGLHWPGLTLLGGISIAAGWCGSAYLLARKRAFALGDLMRLFLQLAFLPWLRLYWVLRGEWNYRRVRVKK